MVQVIGSGNDVEVYLEDEEYKAYQIIKLWRGFGGSPKDVKEELKKEKLSNKSIMAGLRATRMGAKGANVYKGKRFN